MEPMENNSAEAVQIRAIKGRNGKPIVAADIAQAYIEDFMETAAAVRAKVGVEADAAYWASRIPTRGW